MHDPSTIVGNDGFVLIKKVELVTDSEKESKKIFVSSKESMTNRVINEVAKKKVFNFLAEINSISDVKTCPAASKYWCNLVRHEFCFVVSLIQTPKNYQMTTRNKFYYTNLAPKA